MGRPPKDTVDYFPHDCIVSKSLLIVQSQYGNDGYACWFKLLQLLGISAGHFIDYSEKAVWLRLVSETHVPEKLALELLETFASLGMIDKELHKREIVWSQHFVNNVADVYKRRRVDVPQRPGGVAPKKQQAEAEATTNDTIPDLVFGQMVTDYEAEIGMVTPSLSDKLTLFQEDYPEGWFKMAIDEAVNQNVKKMSYIEGILKRWKADGINPINGVLGKKSNGDEAMGRFQEYKD